MTRNSKTALSGLTVAVVEPEFAANLGYIARVMANFGLNKLIVVSSKRLDTKWLEEARVFASHGKKLIDHIAIVHSVVALRRKFQLLIGTTAIEGTRKSNLTRKTLGVEECASKLAGRIAHHPGSSCIVFGRDTTGMTNEELRCCDYTLTIRASEEYNTLNVSHAAAIILFVFSRALESKRSREKPVTSTRRERERAVILFEKLAEEAGFQNFKSGLLREAMTRLFDRADPSLREIYLMMGLASKSASKIRRLTSQQP
ncbi:MAG: RNA methyltransferase [Nitrososphaerota archaeon]|nr:RNA methyltransferase [Nitrososphaerota archaeon]